MNKFISSFALAAGIILGAQSANAGAIQVGLQSPGTNGGNITVVATATDYFSWPMAVSYGGFNTSGSVVDGDLLGPPNVLFSNSIDVSTAGGGDLTIIVASSGLTNPTGINTSWSTTFTSNSFNNISVTMSAYLDLSNEVLVNGASTLPVNAMLLATTTISGVTTSGPYYNSANISGPFSVFEVYHLVSTGSATFNLTISEVATVPAPAPLALLGFGLAGLAGFVRRRRAV